jgi:uncharacterized protein (TIRG00374 family)
VRKQAFASLLLGLLLSAAGLWYAFHGVDLSAVIKAIGRIGGIWVVGSVLVGLASLVLRAVRWRFLLEASPPVGISALTSATFIGMAANNLLPARLGEAVRAWILANRRRMSLPTVLASIMVERLLDVIALLVLLGACLSASPGLDGEAAGTFERIGLMLLGLVTAGSAAILVTVRFRGRLGQAMDRWAKRKEPSWRSSLVGLVHRFVEGLYALRGVPQLLMVAGLSLLVWAASIASFHLLADGFGLGLSWSQTTLVFVMVLLGIAMPSAPGYVGTFHGICVAGLVMVAGVDQALALAYATALHGSQWLAVNLVGLGCFLGERPGAWAGLSGFLRRR